MILYKKFFDLSNECGQVDFLKNFLYNIVKELRKMEQKIIYNSELAHRLMEMGYFGYKIELNNGVGWMFLMDENFKRDLAKLMQELPD